MEVLKLVLSARQDKSPKVQALLDCLADAAFSLQVCICSVGGVGSTELSNFLTQAGLRCNLLTDQDAVRHVPNPPPHLSSATKVVYLFGDPLAAVASHYRRNHALHQAQKTCGQATKLDAATFPATFEQYVDRGEDLFGLEQHLHNWLHTPTPYDVLFVRYEQMFDPPVAQALFTHLCTQAAQQQAPQAAAAASSSSAAAAAAATAGPSQPDPLQLAETFSALKRQRASRVTQEQRAKLYVQLKAEMEQLPPIFLRTADCSQIRPLLSPDTAAAAAAAAAAEATSA